jgi:XTP/dITP diphosphohydrolase
MGALREELGDVLFQVVIHSQLAGEEGTFDLADVAADASAKLVRRHPHVFAGTTLAEGDVLAQWERIKRAERGEGRASVLEGLPPGMPALFAAERLLERAGRVGIAPQRKAAGPLADQRALGDALFELVALAREQGLDAETALREANERFAERVRASEDHGQPLPAKRP